MQFILGNKRHQTYCSTVEPVWGTLINFTGMKRLNARGIKAANKMLLIVATGYNLKKWLKFTAPKTNIKAMVKTKTGEGFVLIKNILLQFIVKPIQAGNFSIHRYAL